MDTLQNFIALTKYARWLGDDIGINRRETWAETVDRWWDWLTRHHPVLAQERPDIKQMVYNHEAMPSMRSLMTAGVAADRDNTCIYNCAYLAIDSWRSFAELMFILANGTGVGFSVEHESIDKLPTVAECIVRDEQATIFVGDSKEDWATSLCLLMEFLARGIHPTWNTSQVRRKGMRLKTFGGRASGPEPLEQVFRFVTKTMYAAQGRKLTPLEAHDICCAIADAIIVGGVRRSAMISLSDLDSVQMATAKSGAWPAYRQNANNSAVYESKPTMEAFLKEWNAIYTSYSGERGIFSREGAIKSVVKRGRRTFIKYGTNPCGEIILPVMGFCNLTEAVVRFNDSYEDIKRKVEAAVIIGTLQSSFTNFPYLRKEWQENCELERLLGVSLTGVQSNSITNGNMGLPYLAKVLDELRDYAREVNAVWAKKIGINPSLAITCVKPSGTVSLLVGSEPGLHQHWSTYWIRRCTLSKNDGVCKFLMAAGWPGEQHNSKDAHWVFEFPCKAPYEVKRKSAIEQLELWKVYKDHWTDHNPSVTINYKPEEFLEVGAWVYKHWDSVVGLSFLPYDDNVYTQTPLEAITELQYNERLQALPELNWELLPLFEEEDTTGLSREFACVGNSCDKTV